MTSMTTTFRESYEHELKLLHEDKHPEFEEIYLEAERVRKINSDPDIGYIYAASAIAGHRMRFEALHPELLKAAQGGTP
jgi:hypothetical protein